VAETPTTSETVEVVTKYGERGTLPVSQVAELEKLGGRLATPKELAAERLDAEYASKSAGQKALGALSPALPYPVQAALRATGNAPLPPTLEAYRSGASQGFTGGLDEVATMGLARAIGGAGAGEKYGQHVTDVRENSPIAHGVGEFAGLTAGLVAAGAGGAGGAGSMTPVGLLSRLGAATESRAIGALARAVSPGVARVGGMAARGAVEGAVLSASKQATEDMLGPHDMSAEKLVIAGGLGALAGGAMGAGFGTAGAAFRGVFGRAATREAGAAGTAAREAAEAETGALGRKAATEEAKGGNALVRAAAEGGNAGGVGARATVDDFRREVSEAAYARATSDRGAGYQHMWKALGGTSAANREAIDAFGPEGGKVVGEILHRTGVYDTSGGAMSSAWKNLTSGHPTDILPRITAAREAAVGELTDILGAQNGRIHLKEVVGVANDIGAAMSRDPARIGTVNALGGDLSNMVQAMRNAGQVAEDGTVSVRDLFAARRSLESKVHTYGADTLSKQTVKQWLREVDKLTLSKVEPGASRRIVELKHDLRGLHIAEDAAEASQTRYLTNRNMGLTSYGVGLAVGGPKGVLAAMAHQYVKDRGNAAAGAALIHLADLGYLSRVNRAVDDLMNKAVAGAIHGPGLHERAARPLGNEPLRKRAVQAMNAAKSLKADPEATASAIEKAYAPVVRVAPNVGAFAIQRTLDAINMVASRAPVTKADPLNPYGPPKMNDLDAASFTRTYEYAQRPYLFFEDAAAGRVSHEGASVIRALAPKVYADFQQRIMAGLQEQIASGKPVRFEQRVKLALVVNFPTDPALDPKIFAGLQENVSSPPQGKPGGGGGGKMAVPGAEPSVFDRLEKE